MNPTTRIALFVKASFFRTALTAKAVGAALTATGVSLALAGCGDHKALYVDNGRVDVRVVADYEREWEYPHNGMTDWIHQWQPAFTPDYEALRPELPGGIAISTRDTEQPIFHRPAAGGKIHLLPGLYDLICYSDDYEYVRIENESNPEIATATTREGTLQSIGQRRALRDPYDLYQAPERFYAGVVRGCAIGETDFGLEVPVTLRPLTYTYYIHCEFAEGFEYVQLAQGRLKGMARSVRIATGETSHDVVAIPFDMALGPNGLDATVMSFGVPDWSGTRGDSDGPFKLTLQFRLSTGVDFVRTYNITDQIVRQPRGGVIRISGIRITDYDTIHKGEMGVDIDDWGDVTNITMEI